MAPFAIEQLCEREQSSPMSLSPGLLLTPDFPPDVGGIASYLFSVYGSFELSQLVLIAPQRPQAAQFDATQQYRANRFVPWLNIPGIRSVEYIFRTYREAESLVRKRPKLLLHCGHILAAMAARRLKRKYGVPYLVWTYALEIMDKRMALPIRTALLEADCVITDSNYTRYYVQSVGVPDSRIKVIRPCVDNKRFRPSMDTRAMKRALQIEGRKILLTVGAFTDRYHYKGQDMVIRALPKIAKAVPNVLYVIAGVIQDRDYLVKLAQRYGVGERIRIVGRISSPDLPVLYNCADLFLMCSREEQTARGTLAEGFGVAFLEASSCAKPVIGGNSGGVPDAVLDGITGSLVNPIDPDAIAGSVISLLSDPCLALQLGMNGRRWVEQEMTAARAAREFSEIARASSAIGN